MDHGKFRKHVEDLYCIVRKLEAMFDGRHFTPDGHMVGSLGECLVAEAYDLDLERASNPGYDAKTKTRPRKKVEIKTTQGKRVAFRSCPPEHTIIIRILEDGTFEECYNGPGEKIWRNFDDRERPSNGQYQISISTVRKLNESVQESDRLPRIR